MKKTISLILGLGLSAVASAKSLPEAPENCAEELAVKNFCSGFEAPTFKGPVKIKFFATVDKLAYPEFQTLLERYTDFASWPKYVEATGRTDVIFNQSSALSPITAVGKDGKEIEILRHYADYKIDSVIGYQDVRVVTHNTQVIPYEGALGSIDFIVQTEGPQEVPTGANELNGSEGVQQQFGSVHAVDCSVNELCSEDQYLLIYESTITPDIDLLPSLAARAINRGVESILIGMFLLDDPIDDDIL